MESHINSVSKFCYLQILESRQNSNYLSEEVAKSLTHAFVNSSIFSMDPLPYSLPNCQMAKPRLIENHAALVVKYVKNPVTSLSPL